MVDIIRGTGEAYAFVECNAIKTDAVGWLHEARDYTLNSGLELSVTEGEEEFLKRADVDPRMRDIAKEARVNITFSKKDPRNKQEREAECERHSDKPFNYFVRARYLGKSNEETARSLGDVLYQFNLSPLYCKGEQFRAAIVYEGDGDFYQY